MVHSLDLAELARSAESAALPVSSSLTAPAEDARTSSSCQQIWANKQRAREGKNIHVSLGAASSGRGSNWRGGAPRSGASGCRGSLARRHTNTQINCFHPLNANFKLPSSQSRQPDTDLATERPNSSLQTFSAAAAAVLVGAGLPLACNSSLSSAHRAHTT